MYVFLLLLLLGWFDRSSMAISDELGIALYYIEWPSTRSECDKHFPFGRLENVGTL